MSLARLEVINLLCDVLPSAGRWSIARHTCVMRSNWELTYPIHYDTHPFALSSTPVPLGYTQMNDPAPLHSLNTLRYIRIPSYHSLCSSHVTLKVRCGSDKQFEYTRDAYLAVKDRIQVKVL